MSGKHLMVQKGCAGCEQVAAHFVTTGERATCATHGLPPFVDEPQGGKKFDTGKPPMALLSGVALLEIAKVLEFGAKKYAPDNWRGGFAWRRVGSAALRHLFAWLNGEDKDSETGLSHLAHCGCCILFLLEFEVMKTGSDDRYKGYAKNPDVSS